MKKVKSYNLQEILIVLAIIGVLLLLALPNLMPLITKAKSVEAQTQLKYIFHSQKQHHFIYSRYNQELNEIDFESPKTVKEGGSANYNYEIIHASNSSFKARASAVTDFDNDGVFNVWEIDESGIPKEIIKD